MTFLRTCGTLVYYLGFGVLILGLFSLAMGVSKIFSSISDQMASTTAQVGLKSKSNLTSSGIDSLSEPNSMVLFVFDPFVEPFSLMADVWLTQAGIIPLDPQIQETFYPHFRRFYGFLILGLILLFLGTLLKVADEFSGFFGGKRIKLPANFLRIRPGEEKRMRSRAMAEDEEV